MAGLGAPPFAPPLPSGATQPGEAVLFGLNLTLTAQDGTPTKAGSAAFGTVSASMTVTTERRGVAFLSFPMELDLTPTVSKRGIVDVDFALELDLEQEPLRGGALFTTILYSFTVSGRGPRRRGDLSRRIQARTDGPAVRRVPEYLRRR